MRVINIDCDEKIEKAFNRIIDALGDGIEDKENSETVFICKHGEDIKKRGYHIPDVFLFQQEIHGETFYYDFFWDVDAVRTRLASFKQCENCISDDDLKDWCIGALRMKLGLDEYCHGVTSCNPLKNPEVLIENAKKVDDALLKELFEKELEELEELEELKPDDIAEFLKKIEPRGSQVRFLKPFGKLNALLIDDEALEGEAPAEWKNNLNIVPLIFDEEKTNKKYKIEWLIKKLDSSRYQFDVILLDLCIKDELNDDPTGYTFLPVLRQFFPLTPIIVYSSFTDMGHISRAFRDGATWYLRKENKHKLARHIVSIFSHPQWEREWSAIKNYSFEPKGPALDDIDKFLIASPTKNLPGNEIKWKQTNEGASSSKTYIIGKDYSKAVVKIDAPAKTKSEYDRYQRFIRPYLDNNAGRIYTPPVIADYQKSAIAYTFAGSASCEIEIFRERIKKALCGEESIKKIKKNINDLYYNLISQLHRVKIEQQDEHRDYPNLFYYETEKRSGTYAMKMPNQNIIDATEIQNGYCANPKKMFISRGISRGKNSVHFFDCNDLTPYKIQGDLIRTAGMHELNPFIFKLESECVPVDKLQNKLQNNLREFFDDEHRTKNIDVSIVHGDLNTGNIMLEEGSDKIWLIDFAVTHRDTPIIDYTVLYYSVLRDLRDILCVEPSPDNFIQLILSSLLLDDSNGVLRLNDNNTLEHCKWENAAVLLTHITSKVPKKWLPAYQCGVAMSLIYGTRNLIDSKDAQKNWSEIAEAAATAIEKLLTQNKEASN